MKYAVKVWALVLVGLLVTGCGSASTTSATQATTAASTAASPPAPPPTTTVTPTQTTTTANAPTAKHSEAGPAATVRPSTTALSPNQILSQGEDAVKTKAVSGAILKAAIRLGTAQAEQLGQPSSQYVATATFIGYLDQLQVTCSDSPDRLATVVMNVGNALYRQDHTATYGQVVRVLYESAVGKAKHACAAELAAAAAATSGG